MSAVILTFLSLRKLFKPPKSLVRHSQILVNKPSGSD